jgi:hypothetical protein
VINDTVHLEDPGNFKVHEGFDAVFNHVLWNEISSKIGTIDSQILSAFILCTYFGHSQAATAIFTATAPCKVEGILCHIN